MRKPPDPFPPIPPSGIPGMDAAHARLWAQLHQVGRMLEQALLPDALIRCVGLLMELRQEYAGEEALMAQHGYSGMVAHRASHTLLESEFSQLARAIRDAGQDPPGDVHGRLVEMLFAAARQLAAHVQEEDIPLARHVLAVSGPEPWPKPITP